MQTPEQIVKALQHVRKHHPDVVRVVFDKENAECGGFWRYENEAGGALVFGPEIDVYLLEQALDAAWEDRPFPATYALRKIITQEAGGHE